MFDIEAEIKKLPSKPGVYIMRDKNDKIIYVGKAISLKNRVTQYFRKTNKTERIKKMVSLIDHFEYIVVDNEAEALVLECNLIKENRPKFNVLLKDDKTYPYIKVDVQSDFPNVFLTRRIINDGAKYFGPYPNSGAAKEMVDFIKKKFKIRQCKNFKSNTRVCLNYHIKRCMAPCAKYVTKEEYKKQIDQILLLLEGKTESLTKKIMEDMKKASDKQDYEQAGELRDTLNAIERIAEKQKVANISENDIDVIGISKTALLCCIEIFFVRGSKMIGRDHYFLDNVSDMNDEEILSSFIKQYYLGKADLPNKIMIKNDIEEKSIIEKILTEKAGRKVEIKFPQRGEKLRFVEMAENNSKITLENRLKEKNNILEELKITLGLDDLPRKIEMYDISNIAGSFIVAGMVVAQDGVIKKNLSRRFKIKTLFSQDDPRCMEEVITRRLKHSIEDPEGGFGKLPNVIFTDGGITQMRAVRRAIDLYGINIVLMGLVKNDKHKTKAMIYENRKEIQLSEDIMNFVTNMQEEVHKVAIEYHRKLRDKEMSKSKLDDIPGIGDAKKKLLLKTFGSVKKIKEADLEEIAKIKGINKTLARTIKETLEKG